MYITLEQLIRNNGHRHLERALFYKEACYPIRFYEGSLAKAKRNYERANSLAVPEEFKELVDLFVNNVADNILYGAIDNEVGGLFKYVRNAE